MDNASPRTLGLPLPHLGLGGAPFGREIDEKTSRTILDYALENGVTLLDTAESYGGGEARSYRREVYGIDDVRETSDEMHSSEKIIGRWMRDRNTRNSVVLCTKCSTGGRPENVQRAVRDSLERLRTDNIDIYMMHTPDPKVPMDETLDALTREVRRGRIRSIGCSNFTCEQLGKALELSRSKGYARMKTIQPAFSLAQADARLDLLPFCGENKVAVISYSPLAAGFLSGKYSPSRDAIPKGTRFDVVPGHIDVYFNDHNFRILESLRELSSESGRTMVYLAMAWATGYPGLTSVLIGARKRAHIDNAVHCLGNPLSPALRRRMTNWLDPAA